MLLAGPLALGYCSKSQSSSQAASIEVMLGLPNCSHGNVSR